MSEPNPNPRQYVGLKLVDAWAAESDDKPGYAVRYKDGYQSWSPQQQFEDAYREVDGLTFGIALEAVMRGGRATRASWDDSGKQLRKRRGDKRLVIDAYEGNELLNTTFYIAVNDDLVAEDWVIL